MDDCALIQSLNDAQVWDYLEGNLDEDFCDFIRKHSLWCRSCLEFYSTVLDRLRESNPKRYDICHIESFAVRKAELSRFCKRNDIEVDITSIKTPEDFFRYAFGSIMVEHRPEFYKIWDRASSDERSEMIIGILQSLTDPEP